MEYRVRSGGHGAARRARGGIRPARAPRSTSRTTSASGSRLGAIADAGEDADRRAPRPAARPIRRSAGESPTTAVRSGGDAERSRRARSTGSGAGLFGCPSSAQARAANSPAMPERRRASARSGRGRRSSRPRTVATRARSRREQARRGPSPAAPGRPDPARARRSATAAAAVAGPAPAPRRRLRRPPGSGTSAWRPGGRGLDQAGRRIDAEQREQAVAQRQPGRRLEPASRAASTQPPHIRWNSISVPSLSKTSRSMPSSAIERHGRAIDAGRDALRLGDQRLDRLDRRLRVEHERASVREADRRPSRRLAAA